MRMIRPKLDAPQLTIAEDQEEFQAITAAIVAHPDYQTFAVRATPGGPRFAANSVVVAFRPSEEERKRIAAGADIYVSQLTYGKGMRAIMVAAGPEDFARIFNVGLEK